MGTLFQMPFRGIVRGNFRPVEKLAVMLFKVALGTVTETMRVQRLEIKKNECRVGLTIITLNLYSYASCICWSQ